MVREASKTDRSREFEQFSDLLRRGAAGPNSYVALLGMRNLTLPALLREVEKGLPYRAYEQLVRSFALSADEALRFLGIPRRTLVRRKLERRFSLDESDRLLRVARVFARA